MISGGNFGGGSGVGGFSGGSSGAPGVRLSKHEASAETLTAFEVLGGFWLLCCVVAAIITPVALVIWSVRTIFGA